MGGEEVKQKLLARGWTLTRLAERIGVSVSQVSRVVSGRRISPYLQTAIAEVVGVEAADLFGPLHWMRFVHSEYEGLRAIPPRSRDKILA